MSDSNKHQDENLNSSVEHKDERTLFLNIEVKQSKDILLKTRLQTLIKNRGLSEADFYNSLGLTKQQAKAETIFQLAIDGSKDALESFETNTDSLVRQQSILTATLEEQTEHLGGFLTPAFLAVLKAANSLTKTTKDLAEEIIKENKAFEKQTGRGLDIMEKMKIW